MILNDLRGPSDLQFLGREPASAVSLVHTWWLPGPLLPSQPQGVTTR